MHFAFDENIIFRPDATCLDKWAAGFSENVAISAPNYKWDWFLCTGHSRYYLNSSCNFNAHFNRVAHLSCNKGRLKKSMISDSKISTKRAIILPKKGPSKANLVVSLIFIL